MEPEEVDVCRANLEAYNLMGAKAMPKEKFWAMVEKINYWKIYAKVDSLVGGFNGKCVIDVGCGTATHLGWLCNDCVYVVGLDISVDMLKLCRKTLFAKNIDYVVGDALHLPFRDNSFDVATTIESIHHFPNIWKALKEMTRVAGKIAFSEPNKESFIHHLLEKIRKKSMRDTRFTHEHPYELVEYQSIGFSGREVKNFLRQRGVHTVVLSIISLPMETSVKLLKMSKKVFFALNAIGSSLEKIPVINNQIGDILVVGIKKSTSK